MLLQEPVRTPYDLTFHLFGFEVRTSIFFFVLPLLIGRGFIGGEVNPGVGLLLMAVVFWVSVLVHELGHAFAFRYFGVHSRVVLYWMGGLAIPTGGGVWNTRRTGSLNSKQQIIVSLAGPVAGFLLAAVLCLLVVTLKGTLLWGWLIPYPIFGEDSPVATNQLVQMVFEAGIVINVFLNLLNLVPIYPLDGGQVARHAFLLGDPWNGLRKSLILSIVAAVGMVLISFQIFRSPFIAILFGLLAFSNVQELRGPRW
jgi:Zn-dependent protease